jgi:dipeptidyl aminopeptidase/acylaminoacyl peptidase
MPPCKYLLPLLSAGLLFGATAAAEPPSSPIERFLNIRACSAPSFSPDGRRVSFLTNVTGVSQLWQVGADGGWPVQLTFTAENIRAAHYNPRKHELIYSMDTGGNERTQLHLLRGDGLASPDGGGWSSTDLTRQPRAVHAFGGYSHDGQRFAFSANRDDPARFDVYVQALDGAARRLHKGPGGYYSAEGWSPDDRSLLVFRMESSFNQDVYLLDAAGGDARHLTPHKGEAQYRSPRWSADGKSVYCLSTAGGRDRIALARIETATGRLTYVETPEHEVDGLAVSPGGRWLAWTVNDDGRSRLMLRDLREDRTRGPAELPLGVVSQLTFAPDDGKLAFVFEGPRHNPDVWLWDLSRSEARPRQLTHASRAGLPFDRFVEPELIHYSTFDGRSIPAWYYPPAGGAAGDRPPPVIVYPHGGPESQTRPAFNPLFHFFTQHGYAVLAPNVRGSSGYGAAYMNLDNTTHRMDSVKDLAHAAYWLRDRHKGDPRRLAVYGGSYGGFMVLAAVTHYPELWAAGIDVVGIANFATFVEKTGAYRRTHREAEYGNLREHRAFFEKISPIHHVDRIKCPLMVIHGANDPRVPIEEAEQIVAALKKRGLPVQYLRYEDEGHGLSRLKNRLDAYPKMVLFLDRYLNADRPGQVPENK